MPYRRLPRTDAARQRILQKAIEASNESHFSERVLSYKTLSEAQRMLGTFTTHLSQYKQNVNSRVVSNKPYKRHVNNARMYISHFIQVLNMCVIRGEIKAEKKELYKLSTTNHVVPDLTTEEDLLKWGKNIIEGENERIRQGGIPIYNPTITKVQVYYDIFKEHQITQTLHKKSVNRTFADIDELRKQADAIIIDIWNQVETYFADCLPYERLQNCERYGMTFYYHKGEKRKTPDTDKRILDEKRRNLTIPLE